MADETLNLAFQQFLAEQKKTNQLLHQQAAGEEKGDNIIASARNAAAEIINDSRLAIKNRKEHDQTQEAIVNAEKENTKKVETVESAVTKSGDKQTKAIEDLVGAQTTAQSAATKSAAATTTAVKSSNANAFSHHLVAKQQYEETREREMRLLKVNEEQYEDIIKQRKIVEKTEKELKAMGEAIKGEAKENKEYQKIDLQLKREQAKLAARENKRNLLGRFKTGVAASKPVQMLGDVKRKFIDPVKGFFKKFPKIISLALGALLLLFVNSEFYMKTKKFLQDYFAGKGFGEIITDIIKLKVAMGALGIAIGVVGTVIKTLGMIALAKKMGLVSAGAGGGAGSKGQKKPRGRFGRIASGLARAGTGLLSMVGLGAAASTATTSKPPAAPTSTPPPKAANTNVKPSGSSGVSKFFHLNKFPALEAIAKKIPYLGTALSAAFLAPILMDDTISKEKKIQAVGGVLGGVLGGVGGAKLGALTGALGGPIGALVGGILGSIGGFMFGDFVGLKLAEFLMTGKQPKNDAPGAAVTGDEQKKPVLDFGQPLTPFGQGLTEEQKKANIKSAAEMQRQIDTRPERVKNLKELAAKGSKGAAKELDRLDIRHDTPKTLRMKNEAKHFKRLFRPRMMDEDPNTYLDDRRRELERRRLDRMSAVTTPAANQVAQMSAATADKVDGGGKPPAPIIMTNQTVNEGEKTEQSLGMPQQLVDNSSVGILANQGSLVSGFA